jgi:hypothetical protein
MFGQSPCVGISSLLLDADLINTLSTEAQLNRVVEYEGMVEAWDDELMKRLRLCWLLI